MQKIKAASELYIETEKKKREKAYLGKYRAIWLCLEPLELEDGPGGRGEPEGAGRRKRESGMQGEG